MKKYTTPRTSSICLETESPFLSVSGDSPRVSNDLQNKMTNQCQLSNKAEHHHSGIWDGMSD